jgi:hypothetical protein
MDWPIDLLLRACERKKRTTDLIWVTKRKCNATWHEHTSCCSHVRRNITAGSIAFSRRRQCFQDFTSRMTLLAWTKVRLWWSPMVRTTSVMTKRTWVPVFRCSSGVRDDLLESWRRWHRLGNRRSRWVFGVHNIWLRKTLNRRFLKVCLLEIEQ